jgi:Tol biopolymer transport system component
MASMGDDGTLAYLVGAPQSLQQIVNEKGVVVDSFPAPSSFVSPSWSPDGTRIAVGMGDGANPPDVWVYDLRSRVLTRVATDGIRTAWTSDGKRIAFISSFLIRGMGSGGDAMWVAADGSSPAEAIPAAKGFPTRQIAFSADGKWLVLQAIPARGSDQSARAFAFPLAGGEPVALMPGVVDVAEPAISPNGKWISYTSTETGRPEIAVRPFPTGSGKVQISTNGGWEARWSRDGTKLFYRTSSAVRAATLDITGAMPRLVRSDSLFPDTWVSNSGAFSWDVSGDGKRFLLRREIGGARIVVEKNWLPEVVAKLGATR